MGISPGLSIPLTLHISGLTRTDWTVLKKAHSFWLLIEDDLLLVSGPINVLTALILSTFLYGGLLWLSV